MDLKNLFKHIKKTFSIKKNVDFEEFNLHFIMEPITTAEEMRIFEACKGYEGGAFMAELKRSSVAYAIKRINDIDLSEDFVEYEDDSGKKVAETKYLFLIRQIDTWPVGLRDLLFDAFNEMQLEVDSLVTNKSKFERFHVQAPPVEEEIKIKAEAGIPQGFKKVEEPKGPEPENETDRLNQRVKEEAEMVEAYRSQKAMEAEK